MDSALYNRDFLRLATSLVAGHRLADPDGTAEVRSPLCGSRIQADVVTDADGILCELALRANACALGQASAAILTQNAVGTAITEIATLREGVAQALEQAADMPSCWPELALLAAATDYPSRHAAILLPYDAILAAAAQTKEKV
jgi:NifU-like protein involved in Fe-S cluster formation